MLIPPGIEPSILPPLSDQGFSLEPGTSQPAPAAVKPDEIVAKVDKFRLSYAPAGSKPNPKLPPLDKLIQTKVQLTKSAEIYVPADPKAPKTGANSVPIVATQGNAFRGDALLKISEALVGHLNELGIYGIYAMVDPSEIDPSLGANYDKRKGGTELTIQIFVSEVSKVRTVRRKVPFRTTDRPSIDDSRDVRIKQKSPVFATSETRTGGLLERRKLQDYLARINRFPGRRVDAAINASGEAGKITLDYLIREEKPLFAYAQTSNTGTESTGEWRTRVGAEYKQLMRLDDILRVEYLTTDLEAYNSALLSYEFAPIFPDYLKSRTYASYSKYSAEDIGFALQEFESTVWIAGTQLVWTPLYIRGLPVDIIAGVEGMKAAVDNRTVMLEGEANFLMPYLGLATELTTEKFSFSASIQAQMNLHDVAGTDEEDLRLLGRFNADEEFIIGKWNLAGSFFLEPIIFGKQWDEQKVWWKSTRAHEFAGSFRGQVAMDDARLVPQLQMVAGGFDTVRGYPESFVSGDSVMLATAEYRFHVPRQFLKPQDVIDKEKAAKTPGVESSPPARFASRPPTTGSSPDWDLIARGFVDFGKTYNNQIIISERNRTLLSVGGGLELQIFKPLYVSLRADLGFVLEEQSELLIDTVSHGATRFHFSGTIAW